MCFTEKDVNLVLVYDTLNSFTDAVLHRQKNAREVKLVGTTVTKPTDQNKEEWCQGIGWLPIDLFSGIYMHVWACLCTQSRHRRRPMMNVRRSVYRFELRCAFYRHY